MENSIHFSEDDNCFLVNNKVKVDNNKIEFLFLKRNLEDLIKLEDNLYYYKDKTLLEILFGIKYYESITFNNNNNDDYRFKNLNIKYNKIQLPIDVQILENGTTKYITEGKYAGTNRNMYWKVKDSSGEYYIMHIYNNIYTKFSIKDLNNIIHFMNIRPTWGYSNEYVKTNILCGENHKVIYLHQYIMGCHFEDNTNMKKTVDHINRDKLDNRRENLRFATMTEQNLNKGKQKRQKNACKLPECIVQSDLPIHVCYNKRCYNKENNSWREFFTIDKRHPKLDKSWESSKSNNVSLSEKLEQTKLKLKNLNGEISDKDYKKMIEPEFKLFKGLRLSIDQKYNKYKFEYDNRTANFRFNYKMILIHNDLQLMIDKLIDLLNDKYKDNKDYKKIEYYKLEKSVILDFSNVNNEIIEDGYDNSEEQTDNSEEQTDNSEEQTDNSEEQTNNSEEQTNNSEEQNNTNVFNTAKTKKLEKYKIKPDLPPNFSLYIEKNAFYLSFSKIIDTIRYSKKIKLECMCIQTEINRFIDEINNLYSNLKLEKYSVKNPYDFIDSKPLKNNIKPIMPSNFCITNINSIDNIQFTKKINNKNVSYKIVIKSYDLQKELDQFVDNLNKKYNLNISPQKIIDTKNWKTTNKVK